MRVFVFTIFKMSYLSFEETKNMFQLDDTFTFDMYQSIMNLNARIEFINGKFGHTIKSDPNNPERSLVLDKEKLKVIQVQPEFITFESYVKSIVNIGFCPDATTHNLDIKPLYDCLVNGGFLIKNTSTKTITSYRNLESLHVFLNHTKDLNRDLTLQSQNSVLPQYDRVFVSSETKLHYTDVAEYNRVLNNIEQIVLSSNLPDYTKGRLLFKFKL